MSGLMALFVFEDSGPNNPDKKLAFLIKNQLLDAVAQQLES